MVDFEYDDRGRLISEERTVGQTDVYDLAYTYDQLGNRQSKVDAVSGQWVVYDYDVDLADPNALEFPTWHNRLLEYRMYDRDPNDPNTILLRTVSYTYYKTGQASNITVKDEDPDPDPVNGPDPAYDVYHDLALYYHSHGPLWRALWGLYTLDQSGDPTGYETSWARELFYDSPRQRFLAADYDTNGYDDEPDRWTWNTGLWTEYSGELPYADLETTRYLPDEQNHPHQHAYTRSEMLHYLGTAAQQTTDTPPETAFHHGDLIGSTNLTTDNSGDANQTPAVAYTAFGEIIGDASTLATRHQYAGRYGYESDLVALSGVNANLPDIILQHVGHRWYQPDLGRFVQRDPIGVWGGANVYTYCAGDPVAVVDPSGLVPPHGGCPTCGRYYNCTCKRRPKPPTPPTEPELPSWPPIKVKRNKIPRPEPWPKNVVKDLVDDYLPFIDLPINAILNWARLYCIWYPIEDGVILCFAEGTTVQTLDGPVAIEAIAPGMTLRSREMALEAEVSSHVTAVTKSYSSSLVRILLDNEVIACTKHHPFWVVGAGWTEAQHLNPRQLLMGADGQSLPIRDVVFVDLPEATAVFDITVSGTHTYRVGESGVLVHNKPR